ncbi:hypothetical protein ACROYT_G022572 [Oculina patagonica]
MDPSYVFLMALHLVGVLFNIRMLASCFKDKAKYTILQRCRPVMITQCILHLSLLALNANEVTRAFRSEQGHEWCGTTNVLMTSVGFLMIYNLLAILAIEDHTIVGLKREVSTRVAMSGTLIAGVISCGMLLWAGAASTSELCVSYLASSVACTLMMFLLLLLAFRICTQTAHDSAKTSMDETSLWLNILSKNKTAVFFIALIVFCIVLAVFEVLSAAVISIRAQESIAQFQESRFFQKVFYLNIIWFAVGVALPVIFRQLIDSNANSKEITDENHYSANMVFLV